MRDIILAARIEQNLDEHLALKVIGAKATTGKELLRFEQERLIRTKLCHTNIAIFLEEGIRNEGRAYYVIEFVDGKRINDYCIQKRFSRRDRLDLIVEV